MRHWPSRPAVTPTHPNQLTPGLLPHSSPNSCPNGLGTADVVASSVVTGRVLVVDDNPQNVLLIRGQLEREGYVVESATSGREGLDFAVGSPPDVILLDIMMP